MVRGSGQGEVGEGGEHRQEGSTGGIVGEVEVGEVPEATKDCWDVASEGVPSEGEHREASGTAKGEGDDARDGGRVEVEDDVGGQEAGAKPVKEGAREEEIIIAASTIGRGVVALVDGDAKEKGGMRGNSVVFWVVAGSGLVEGLRRAMEVVPAVESRE